MKLFFSFHVKLDCNTNEYIYLSIFWAVKFEAEKCGRGRNFIKVLI